MNKRVRSVCAYCNCEWDDEYDVPEGYEHGFSICNDCVEKRGLNTMKECNSFCTTPSVNPEEFQLWNDLTRRDVEKFRGAKCNWCSKKSIGRIRYYDMEGDLRNVHVINACKKHFKKLKPIINALNNGGKLF